MREILAIAKADFLQRVRGYGFLITLGVCVFTAYAVIPAPGSKLAGVLFNDCRGLNNCAWIGLAAALVFGLYATLAGYYLVNNAIARDVSTGVGQIIAATPVRTFQYLLGKTLSNLAVLFSMFLTMSAVNLAVFFLKGEGGGFAPAKLLAPLVLIIPPGLVFTAAMAVFFESIPRLSRGVINILWYFIWLALLIIPMTAMESQTAITAGNQAADLVGVGTLITRVENELGARDPHYKRGSVNVCFPVMQEAKSTFRYDSEQSFGMSWAARWLWVLLMPALLGLAALWFHRFDARDFHQKVRADGRGLFRWLDFDRRQTAALGQTALSKLPAPDIRFRSGRIIRSELRLMLQGRSWWWQLVTLGLFIATMVVELPVSRAILLPILWFWQILLYSNIGSRESVHRTGEVLFAAPRPLARQLPAAFAAVALYHILLAFPVLVRNALAGDLAGVLGIVAGAMFLSALALALGSWTGGAKLFEVVYTILWYGLLNGIPALDYMGGLPAAWSAGVPWVYLALAGGFLLLAIPGRCRQMQY